MLKPHDFMSLIVRHHDIFQIDPWLQSIPRGLDLRKRNGTPKRFTRHTFDFGLVGTDLWQNDVSYTENNYGNNKINREKNAESHSEEKAVAVSDIGKRIRRARPERTLLLAVFLIFLRLRLHHI